jgi:FMN-dependent oxidoreductase (nitrilotriacetate monooxygenase family)
MTTTERRTDKLNLLFFMSYSGAQSAAWRHPDAPGAEVDEFEQFRSMVATAERAKFDAVFVGDSQGFPHTEGREAYSRMEVGRLEPFTLLSALAMVTTRIGLAGTASTSYNHPYTIARKFASLDRLSKGRAGWNVVTTSHEQEARNFGREANFEHGERYARAQEFIDICKGLWDSWDDDAIVRDRDSGLYFDPDKLHGLFHDGKFFKVEGPLNIPRSPQGYPVIIQAGSSGDGQKLAASSAEVVFTSQPKMEGAQAFYKSVKDGAEALGRSREHLKICPSIQPVVASTEAELECKVQELADLMHIDVALSLMQRFVGPDVIRLRDYSLDDKLPELKVTSGNQTFQAHVVDIARKGDLTIGQTARRLAASLFSGGFRGTPESIADSLEAWFHARAADGFCLSPGLLPTGLDDFCNEVVPILQKRGLFRTEYEGRTLRENLGLPRPDNQYVVHPERHKEPAIW